MPSRLSIVVASASRSAIPYRVVTATVFDVSPGAKVSVPLVAVQSATARAVPLVARTTTSSLLPAASAGAVLATSPGISKSGAVLRVSTPPGLVIEGLSWSAPPRVA